jgi:DNA-binding MarR family transcriptional regulator
MPREGRRHPALLRFSSGGCQPRPRESTPSAGQSEIALTAPDERARSDSPIVGQFPAADETVQRFQRTCHAAIDGRRAARLLASWSNRFGLGEPDLQVLWTLRRAAPASLDQSTLAGRLVISPAQVSATVERLRAGKWIEQSPNLADRRRNLWHLTADGQRMLERILAAAQGLRIADCGLRIVASRACGHRHEAVVAPDRGHGRPGLLICSPQPEEEAA